MAETDSEYTGRMLRQSIAETRDLSAITASAADVSAALASDDPDVLPPSSAKRLRMDTRSGFAAWRVPPSGSSESWRVQRWRTVPRRARREAANLFGMKEDVERGLPGASQFVGR